MGLLLFNIYICGLLLEKSDIDIANYADDNTPHACSSDIDSVIFKPQKNTERNFRWLYNNNLISNAEKSHEHKKELGNLKFIHLNNYSNFDYLVNQLCKKANKKLLALVRNVKYMDINKRRMLMKAFEPSWFSYCPNMDVAL